MKPEIYKIDSYKRCDDHAAVFAMIQKQIMETFEYQMITYPEEAQIIEAIARMTSAKRCLEFGMYTGFATLHMLRAVYPDGMVVSVDPIQVFDASFFGRPEIAKCFKFIRGTSPECLGELVGQDFDLVFFDGDNGGHTSAGTCAQMDAVMSLTHPGSVFVFHDCPKMGVRGFPPGDIYTWLLREVEKGRLRGAVFPTRYRLDTIEAFGDNHEREMLPNLGLFIRN